MSNYSSIHCLEQSEYRKKERIKDRIGSKTYAEDEAYRQTIRERALAYYYRKNKE